MGMPSMKAPSVDVSVEAPSVDVSVEAVSVSMEASDEDSCSGVNVAVVS